MAHPSSIERPQFQHARIWRRRVRRPWARPRDAKHAAGLLSQIPSLPRAALERLADLLIEQLDELDGDTDLEFNGDELDGHNSEDEFKDHNCGVGIWDGPGCPIADPDLAADDFGYNRPSEENPHA